MMLTNGPATVHAHTMEDLPDSAGKVFKHFSGSIVIFDSESLIDEKGSFAGNMPGRLGNDNERLGLGSDIHIRGRSAIEASEGRINLHAVEAALPVPVPSAILLLGSGIAGLIASRKRRKEDLDDKRLTPER